MPRDEAKLRVGISECLLGAEVRYDGGHKRNPYAVETLGQVFAWVAVCPEVEAGMEVPREPVNLRASDEGIRMVGAESGRDRTEEMAAFTVRRLEELADAGLRGFVLKSGSPSCGLRVPVEGGGEAPGLFARALAEHFPQLPTVEETALADPAARQGFVERVFAYDRMMQFFGSERSVGQLVMAHVQARLQLDAHRPGAHAEIGGLFRKAGEMSYRELGAAYLEQFMGVLAEPATPAGHFGVLKSCFDVIKGGVEPAVQKELARALQDYRQGNVPLAVPLTLIRHYVRVQEEPNLNQQTYLEPGPGELLLRTQV